MRSSKWVIWAWLVGCVVLLPASARDAAEAPKRAEQHPARRAGRAALDAKKFSEARGHFRNVLRDFPTEVGVLLDMVRACADDEDLAALYADRWATAVVDKSGRLAVPRDAKDLASLKDALTRQVAKTRAKAAQDLARAVPAVRGAGRWFKARGYARLFARVTRASRHLERAHGEKVREGVQKAAPVLKDLMRAIQKGASRGGPPALRIALGRAIRGLSAQMRQTHEGTPQGDAGALLRLAESILRHAESELEDEQMEPLTLAALEAMKPAEIAAFNAKHTNWATPGRSVTPTGRYAIVTACGHGTLLAATRYAEPTHERLAAWFGKSPFKGKQGLIRIVPSAQELEAENGPWWWAGGFQKGSITTIQHSLGTPMDLVRVLAHELTHRFDGVIYPGLPKWLLEGRAVWTGGAFNKIDAKQHVPRFIDGARVNKVGLGFAKPHWFGRLITGTLEDYRDNYTAGHALWVFLSAYDESGQILFAEPLAHWMQSFKARNKITLESFASVFCDGKEGRPDTLDGFLSRFGDFVQGFRVEEPPAWVKTWQRWPAGPRMKLITDGPTLVRTRKRERPRFGQDHIREAARVLGALGEGRVALGLLAWAIARDQVAAADFDALLPLVRDVGGQEAAASLLVDRERHADAVDPALLGSIERSALLRPVLKTFLATLAEGVALRRAQGHDRAAAAWAEEHDRLARWVGVPRVPAADPPVRLGAERRSWRLDHLGWLSDKLTGYERYPEPDLWMRSPEGHLIVGTKSLNTAGDELESHEASVFLRSHRWVEASYRLRCRVRLLTPFVRGDIVLGHTRPDRNMRVSFLAGRLPRKGEPPARQVRHKRANFSVDTLRPFDQLSANWEQQGVVRFEQENLFNLIVDVKGPTVEVYVEGTHAAVCSDAEGAPVDGYVGFGARFGAYRVEAATVEDLVDQTPIRSRMPYRPSLQEPLKPMGRWASNNSFTDLRPSRAGSVVVWVPGGIDQPDKRTTTRIAEGVASVASGLEANHHPGDIALVLPARWTESQRQQVHEAAARQGGDRLRVMQHLEGMGGRAPADTRWGEDLLYLFVGPRGVIRCMRRATWPTWGRTEDGGVNLWYRWMRLTRGY